jgi:hypothetical protein
MLPLAVSCTFYQCHLVYSSSDVERSKQHTRIMNFVFDCIAYPMTTNPLLAKLSCLIANPAEQLSPYLLGMLMITNELTGFA